MKRGFNFLDYVDDRGTSSSSNVDSNVDVALAGVQALGQYVSPIRMPWESTSLMRQVLKKESLPWLKPVKVPKNFTAVSFNMVQSKEVILLEKKIAIRERSHVVVSSRPADDRDQVLLKWLEVILICPEESKVGRQLLADELAAVSEERHLQIMADSLRKKSTRTLEIRIASLLLYVKWHRSNHASEPFLPFKEEWVYDYLCDLRDKACSASRGTTFISTLSFVKQTVGMSGIQDCVESARVSGAALSMYLTKRPLKQAPPLEPTMLAVLELACFFESDAYLRCMAGFCLVCIYGRMRVSDVSRLVNLSVIGKFAEASLMRVKTSRSREKQTTFLPSIIPVEGVLGFDWFGAFILNRRHLGLEEFPALESRGFERSFVVLPSEDSLHLADYNKVKTSEVTSKMRIILGKFFPREDVAALTSHSLKTTVLTYVSIHGIDYVFSELLGYHLTSHRSAINYQRDALSAPIRAMCDILSKVKTGEFLPLAPRDQVFCTGNQKAVCDQIPDRLGYQLDDLVEMLLGFSPTLLVSGEYRPELARLWQMLMRHFDPDAQSPTELVDDKIFDGIDTEPAASLSREVSDDETADSTSEVTDSCSSSEESALADLAANPFSKSGIRQPSKHTNVEVLFRHRRTKAVHFGHNSGEAKTACGRSVGCTYDRFFGDVNKAWPHCIHCFGA